MSKIQVDVHNAQVKDRSLSTRSNLLRLPNEIIIHILELKHFQPGCEELRNLRLVSKFINSLATPFAFRSIGLPRDLDDLRLCVDTLSDVHILRHVHELGIYVECLMPRHLSTGRGDSHRIGDYNVPRDRTLLPRWASQFSLSIFRILGSCVNLTKLRIEGFATRLYTHSQKLIEEIFCNVLVDNLSLVRLPELRKLSLWVRDLYHMSILWKCFDSGRGWETLTENVRMLQDIHFVSLSGVPLTRAADLNDFISFASKCDLKSLRMLPCMDEELITVKLAPIISTSHSLTTLYMYNVDIEDSFSRVLKNLSKLRATELSFVCLRKSRDRWSSCFDAMLGMEHLTNVTLSLLHYSGIGIHHSDINDSLCKNFCSPFPPDRESYSRLCNRPNIGHTSKNIWIAGLGKGCQGDHYQDDSHNYSDDEYPAS